KISTLDIDKMGTIMKALEGYAKEEESNSEEEDFSEDSESRERDSSGDDKDVLEINAT
ncbi:hypothetical protein KI387_023611, partial [Taxus chinensis]